MCTEQKIIEGCGCNEYRAGKVCEVGSSAPWQGWHICVLSQQGLLSNHPSTVLQLAAAVVPGLE